MSMYIMCAILCLFSALRRREGALQISIIIIIAESIRAEDTVSRSIRGHGGHCVMRIVRHGGHCVKR